MIAANLIFACLVMVLGYAAWTVSYPNLGPLAAICAVGATILFEIATRRARAAPRSRFWRTGRFYAVLIGLVSLYLASDAYVLEKASAAFPAGGGWFIGFLASVVMLAMVMSLRQPNRTDLFDLEPRFTGNGIGIFVVVVSLQLAVMTAVTPLLFNIIAFRLICLAASVWFIRFGTVLRSRPVIWGATAFLLLNVLTAYLDLLWPYREQMSFLGGAAILAALTLWSAKILCGRWLELNRPVSSPQ